MCHTDFMKKSLLLFVPFLVGLVSCNQLRVGFTGESHEPGFDPKRSDTSNSAESYTYFGGDPIDTTNPNVAHLTFNSDNSGSNMSKDEITALINCDVPDFVNEVVDASYVGVKKDTALFIGLDSTHADGYLTLSFNQMIKDVVIKACPYYSDEIIGFTDRVEHDSNVGIAINSNRYFKLTYTYNQETGVTSLEECRYHMSNEDVNEIKIKVGPQRALISEIILYY